MFQIEKSSFSRRLGVLAPGLGLVLLIAALTRVIHGLLPGRAGAALGEVVLGLGLGLLVCNVVRLPQIFEPGIRFAFNRVLPAAIVLLGARISLLELARLRELALILLMITLALLVSLTLGKWLGLPRKLALLIGLGTAICGNTAISVTAPVIHARDEEVSFAIASNTLFGTIAVFMLPLLGHYFGVTDAFFGTWAGVSVNDTSQVAAAGFGFSDPAGDLATSIKLIRNALMGIVVIGVGLAFTKEHAQWKDITIADKIRRSVPTFVIGFLVMAALNTLGFFTLLSDVMARPVTDDLTILAKAMILVALIGVGLGTRLGDMKKMGFRPLAVGLAASLTTTITSFILLRHLFHL